MSLFQSSVLNKYLADQDQEKVKSAFNEYKNYFLNTDIQQNIRNSKEEQFQEGFLRELFVNILGYTINPNPNFNLTTELKNIKNARKTDGAILKADGTALAVIELKGTNTKDLDKVNDQAFNYKNNQPDCVYVITSNFEKLRFFIHNAVEHEEFNLFALTKERFALLWLFLQKDNLLSGIPAKVKEESLLQEDKITKALYADYSAFKNDLWNDMVQQNPQHEPLLLYKKSQKLLDRFLFIFFSEDKGLLPPNSISVIIEQWQKLKDLDEYKPLYDRFKKYFGYMNDGYKGVKYEIHAYNGGLFKTDELLDGLLIDDELLKKHSLKLTNYDFDDEIDTNILGHIFEHSLNDIEYVRAILAGEEIDKSKSKRKKDGVFYTPKYITKYIVDNTVGKLCEEKKGELEIVEEEYARDSKGRRKATLKKLDAKLKEYRRWLLQLTICDPACGSGAFLNQALEFLMAEHRYVDELEAQLIDGSIVFQDVQNHILEHNIFGVDINEESVEIARLSLWLRTAQKGRKLTSLSSNIKCGNSLIDDPQVAGELAFNWQEQFPKVFTKGGFDVVIGNPPYVPAEYISDDIKRCLETTYHSAYGRLNLYPIFYERGILILRPKGFLSFITPYTILKNQYYVEARRFMLDHTTIIGLVDFKGITVFEDAAVDSIILTLTNEVIKHSEFELIDSISNFQSGAFNRRSIVQGEIQKNQDLSFNVSINEKLISRISKNSVPMSSVVNFNQGIITGGNSKFIFPQKKELSEKVVTGSDFNRFTPVKSHAYIIYDTTRLHRSRKREIFEVEEKILLRQTGSYPICTIDNEKHFTLDTVHNGLIIDDRFDAKYTLALLNSKLLRFLYENSINETGKVFAQVKIIYIDPLPFKVIDSISQDSFVSKVDSIVSASSKYQRRQSSFLQHFLSKFDIGKPSTKLKHWPSLDFKSFLTELKKAKVPKLGLEEEAEWMEYFNKKKAEANALQGEINRIDKEIDQMVYKLYGLTDDEINIVEESVK